MIMDYVPNQSRMHNEWFGYARMRPRLLKNLSNETLYVSCDLKLGSYFEGSQNVTWGDPPQESGSVRTHLAPSSVIRF